MEKDEILKMDFDDLRSGLNESKFNSEEVAKIVDTIQEYKEQNEGINIDNILYKAAAQNENTSAETLDKIAALGNDSVKEAVAQNENTSAETLDKLSKSDNFDIQYEVAKNENTSAETLDYLSKQTGENSAETHDLKVAVVQNENTSEATLDRMENSSRNGDRLAVAEGTNSEERQERLFDNDKDKQSFNSSLSNLAKNENISEDMQNKLVDLDNQSIDRSLAGNKNASEEVLDKIADRGLERLSNLSSDTDTTINLDAVIRNENTSTETLEKISDFANENGKDKLLDQVNEVLSERPSSQENDFTQELKDAARDRELRQGFSEEAAGAYAIANNSNTSAETLDKIADFVAESKENGTLNNRSEEMLIGSLAFNGNTSAETLDKVADMSERFSELNIIVQNENTSAETLDKLTDKIMESTKIDDFQEKELLLKIAQNENTSSDTLDKIANNTNDLDIKLAVAEHGNTSTETLETLVDNAKEKIENSEKDFVSNTRSELESVEIFSKAFNNDNASEQLQEKIENNVAEYSNDYSKRAFENEKDFNNAVEAVANSGYDKSAEGNAIDVVKEVATAGYDMESAILADKVNEKFATELSEMDIDRIKEVVGKEMNSEIEAIDNSKDLSMNDIKEINSQEISVQGDHASIKEDTMAGEQTERVVDRETGLNEMDKAVGVDSDKVETKEESALRDGLSTEDQKILDSFDKSEKEITLNDAMESFNSKPQNAELSQENEGQKNAESAKQK